MTDQTASDRSESARTKAVAVIEAELDRAVAELGRMIAVDTTFPPGRGYEPFATLMEELLAPLGFQTRRVTVPETLWQVEGGPASGARVNLIAEMPGDQPVCSLYFHVDTVRAAGGWKRDPFELTVEDDILYGLGAADMKGAIAAALLAVRVAQQAGVELAYRPNSCSAPTRRAASIPASAISPNRAMIAGPYAQFQRLRHAAHLGRLLRHLQSPGDGRRPCRPCRRRQPRRARRQRDRGGAADDERAAGAEAGSRFAHIGIARGSGCRAAGRRSYRSRSPFMAAPRRPGARSLQLPGLRRYAPEEASTRRAPRSKTRSAPPRRKAPGCASTLSDI